jgi:O-methyltransferase
LIAGRAWLQAVAMIGANPNAATLRRVRQALRLQPRYTMMSTRRLVALHDLMCKLDADGIAGDVVECGVWNGGSGAMMASACRDASRRFWLYDSFEGLPPPTGRDGRPAHDVYVKGLCKGDPVNVRRAFELMGANLDQLTIIPGWFDDTLPKAQVEAIALLHVDADWYDPVMLVLETFFDRIAPRGVVVVDDYGVWQGCREALDDFFKERHEPLPDLKWVDRGMVYFERAAISV